MGNNRQFLVEKYHAYPKTFYIVFALGCVALLYALVFSLLLGVMFFSRIYTEIRWVEETISIEYLPPAVNRTGKFCPTALSALSFLSILPEEWKKCMNVTIKFSLTGICVEDVPNFPDRLENLLLKRCD